jgi:hypothetical protein
VNETSIHGFFFNADAEGVPAFYGSVFDPAFLKALSDADPTASVCSRVLRGDAIVEAICVRITSVSQTDKHQSWTQGYDMELYRTVIWDLADAFAQQWHTFDLASFPFVIARSRVHCIVLASFPSALREEVDRRLRDTLGYLGAVELDLGNPVQNAIFVKHLIDDAFISGGAVYLVRNWEGVDDTVFTGALRFSPGGERRLSPEEFIERKPPLSVSDLSERGRISAERYEGKRTFTIEERIINAIGQLREAGTKPFAFTATSTPTSILQADLPEAKFIRYLLNPNHPKGGGKAKFFREVLAIGPDDWRYLAAQFYEGLRRIEFSDLKIKTWETPEIGEDGFGASFNCVLPIKGLNGRVALVLTNWILKPGLQPQFSTAVPAEKDLDAGHLPVAQPSVVSNRLPDKERWEELYTIADEAGRKAAARCVPTPMKVEGYDVEMEGMCGSASVRVADARKGFARWVVRSKLAYKHYRGGAQIFANHPSQSVDRAVAYAKAFAAVLKLNGVECTVESFLD